MEAVGCGRQAPAVQGFRCAPGIHTLPSLRSTHATSNLTAIQQVVISGNLARLLHALTHKGDLGEVMMAGRGRSSDSAERRQHAATGRRCSCSAGDPRAGPWGRELAPWAHSRAAGVCWGGCKQGSRSALTRQAIEAPAPPLPCRPARPGDGGLTLPAAACGPPGRCGSRQSCCRLPC